MTPERAKAEALAYLDAKGNDKGKCGGSSLRSEWHEFKDYYAGSGIEFDGA
jgi:hypothetical protein